MRLKRILPLALLTSLICTLDVHAVEEVVTNELTETSAIANGDKTTLKDVGFSIGYRLWKADSSEALRGTIRKDNVDLDLRGVQLSLNTGGKYFLSYKSLAGEETWVITEQEYASRGINLGKERNNFEYNEKELLLGLYAKHVDVALGLKQMSTKRSGEEWYPGGRPYERGVVDLELSGVTLSISKQNKIVSDWLLVYAGASATYFFDQKYTSTDYSYSGGSYNNPRWSADSKYSRDYDGAEFFYVVEGGLAYRYKHLLLTLGYRYQDWADDGGFEVLKGDGFALTAHLIF